MRITDLLAMLADVDRNLLVGYEYGANKHGKKTGIVDKTEIIPIIGVEIAEELEQPQLIFTAETHRKTLHVWELNALMRQHKLGRYTYVEFNGLKHPLFGFRQTNSHILFA